MTDMIEFVVLHPDGRAEFAQAPGDAPYEAISRYVEDMSTQSLYRLRMWFSDTFTPTMPLNPLADKVISGLGYRHRSGWKGTVALTMEEERGGTIPPLTDEARAAITDLIDAASA